MSFLQIQRINVKTDSVKCGNLFLLLTCSLVLTWTGLMAYELCLKDLVFWTLESTVWRLSTINKSLRLD